MLAKVCTTKLKKHTSMNTSLIIDYITNNPPVSCFVGLRTRIGERHFRAEQIKIGKRMADGVILVFE